MWFDSVNFLMEPMSYSFMVRALIASVLVSAVCPLVGLFVVTRGYGFMGDALAHSVFPGMVAALVIGLAPWFGALPAAIVFAILVGFITRKTGLRADSAIAILFATMFALGTIMISIFRSQVSIDLESLLLGQILAVSRPDLYTMAALATLTAVYVVGFYRPLVFVSFDSLGAEVAGMRTTAIEYSLMATISVVVVLTAQAVGVILVLAMLVAPTASAALILKRHVGVIFLGIGFALFASISGLYLSYYLNLPSGPSIAIVSGLLFGCVALLRRRVA